MITILYPYRNRELTRIKRSLDSLVDQSRKNFKVIFIDYGSKPEISVDVKKMVIEYSFLSYYYLHTENQPWNKAKALNFAIKEVDTDYCFVADIDIIFHNEFIEKSIGMLDATKSIYFQVGYLTQEESEKNTNFENYNIASFSTAEATGMSLFLVDNLKAIKGYDEFFHFWGAEDTDVHNRLENAGYETLYYDKELLLLHQWHPSYRSGEKKSLTADLQLTDVVRMNHEHLLQNRQYKIATVNHIAWGNGTSALEFQQLENHEQEVILLNKVEVISHFLFFELPNFKNGVVSVRIVEDAFQNSIKYRAKKILGKTVPRYYSLKEINDKLLMHIISFYHQSPYTYKVGEDLKSIEFKIKK